MCTVHTGNASVANARAQCTHVPFLPFQPVRIIDSRRRFAPNRFSFSRLHRLSVCLRFSNPPETLFSSNLRVFEALPTGTYVSRLIGLLMRSPQHAFTIRECTRKRKCARSFPPFPCLPSSNSLVLAPTLVAPSPIPLRSRVIDIACYSCRRNRIETSFWYEQIVGAKLTSFLDVIKSVDRCVDYFG